MNTQKYSTEFNGKLKSARVLVIVALLGGGVDAAPKNKGGGGRPANSVPVCITFRDDLGDAIKSDLGIPYLDGEQKGKVRAEMSPEGGRLFFDSDTKGRGGGRMLWVDLINRCVPPYVVDETTDCSYGPDATEGLAIADFVTEWDFRLHDMAPGSQANIALSFGSIDQDFDSKYHWELDFGDFRDFEQCDVANNLANLVTVMALADLDNDGSPDSWFFNASADAVACLRERTPPGRPHSPSPLKRPLRVPRRKVRIL